jgi:hypothetical protein
MNNAAETLVFVAVSVLGIVALATAVASSNLALAGAGLTVAALIFLISILIEKL